MLAGLCHYRDVSESKVDLCDLAIMNELLDVKEYNDWLVSQDTEPEPELPPWQTPRPLRNSW